MSNLNRLLDPQSVVYVGGEQISGPIRAARRAGFEGKMYVVNPRKDEIEGIVCVSSVSELPEIPDAAVVGLSSERSIVAVSELSKAGCGGAVVMVSGFAELNTDEGRDRQKRLVEAAGSMPLIGPNCMGLMNQFSGAFVWGDDNHCERQDGSAAAIISQSGALLIGMTGIEKAFPLGYAISIGNQSATSTADLINAVLEDERIRAIGLYIEGINEGESLGKACLKALKLGVPVVALKGGDQAVGAAVAQSHTASMVVERDIWNAFKRRFGIEEVRSPKALVETLKLLTVGGMPKGNKLSIVSYSGGINGLAATRCSELGIELPVPKKENSDWLEDVLPETVAVANPIDLNIPYRDSQGGISMQDTSGVAEAIIRFASGVSDQIVFFIDVPRPGAGQLDRVWCDSLEALIQVRKELGIPVSVAGILPEGLPEDFRKHMHDNGVAALSGYAETMDAIDASIKLSENKDRLGLSDDPAALCNGNEPECVLMLDEAASKSALQEYGLLSPRREAVTLDEVPEAANRLSYPIAAKVLSNTIAHKAKLGGVKLGLKSAEEAVEASRQIADKIATANGGHSVTRILLEEMIPDVDAELIIGIKRHPSMGLAMMIGQGGSNAEAISSFETLLLPLVENELDETLEALGVSSHRAAAEFKKSCKAVAAYAADNAGNLATLDVNPVMLTKGGKSIAVDALIIGGKKNAS